MRKVILNTQIGRVYVVASDRGLVSLLFDDSYEYQADLSMDQNKITENIKSAHTQLDQYLSGQRTVFDLKLDLKGTDFQKRVWRELQNIPCGKTSSYKEISVKIENEKACRAVGSANGKNPICIVIPCHRVINSDGKLGGYSGGLDKKIYLLDLEANSSDWANKGL